MGTKGFSEVSCASMGDEKAREKAATANILRFFVPGRGKYVGSLMTCFHLSGNINLDDKEHCYNRFRLTNTGTNTDKKQTGRDRKGQMLNSWKSGQPRIPAFNMMLLGFLSCGFHSYSALREFEGWQSPKLKSDMEMLPQNKTSCVESIFSFNLLHEILLILFQ